MFNIFSNNGLHNSSHKTRLYKYGLALYNKKRSISASLSVIHVYSVTVFAVF